jgi:hypothetical protein
MCGRQNGKIQTRPTELLIFSTPCAGTFFDLLTYVNSQRGLHAKVRTQIKVKAIRSDEVFLGLAVASATFLVEICVLALLAD